MTSVANPAGPPPRRPAPQRAADQGGGEGGVGEATGFSAPVEARRGFILPFCRRNPCAYNESVLFSAFLKFPRHFLQNVGLRGAK